MKTNEFETLRVEEHGYSLEVVLSRPPVNAVSSLMYQEITHVFREAGRRQDVHAVLLRSDQRVFSAGADLHEKPLQDGLSETGLERRQRLARDCYEAVLGCPLPTMALVEGSALGAGTVLAACCDMRVASTSAQFGLPEIRAGRCGGGAHLSRLLPQGTVRWMYFTGDPLGADEAYRTGLVQRVEPNGEALSYARQTLNRVASYSPLGLRLAKMALNEAEQEHVLQAYPKEQAYTLRLNQHPDAVEAASALMAKRSPEWTWPAVPENRIF